MLRHALRLVLALALGSLPVLARAELYRWVDELGVSHYTTDPDEVPSQFRNSETAIPTPLPREPSSIPRGPRVLGARPPVAPTPAPTPTPAPAPAATAAPPADIAPTAPAPASAPTPALAPPPAEATTPALAAPPLVAPPPQPQPSEPPPPAPAPQTTMTSPPPAQTPAPQPATPDGEPTVFPGPPSIGALPPDDPRAAEVASLEAQIASDRESLRQIISTKRWDSSELASDPQIREIAERLPRLQAQLEALRAEPIP